MFFLKYQWVSVVKLMVNYILSCSFRDSCTSYIVFSATLTALFKHVESVDEQMTDENLRERTLFFIRDKVGIWTFDFIELIILH